MGLLWKYPSSLCFVNSFGSLWKYCWFFMYIGVVPSSIISQVWAIDLWSCLGGTLVSFGWCNSVHCREKKARLEGERFYVNLGPAMANCYRGGRGGDPSDLPGLSPFVAQLALLLSSCWARAESMALSLSVFLPSCWAGGRGRNCLSLCSSGFGQAF